MPQDTQADLIASIESDYFVGTKLTTLKNQILNTDLNNLGNTENHWTGDWKTYINGAGGDPSQPAEKAEFEARRGSVLLCLARLVIEKAQENQDLETDQAEKKKWWDEIDNYVKTHTDANEIVVYNDGNGGNIIYKDYKKMLADMKVIGTATTTTTTTISKGWKDVGFCQKYLGNDPDEWKKVGLCQRYYG